MTDQEILEKALLKAGYEKQYANFLAWDFTRNKDPFKFLFSHEFAKKFFGEEIYDKYCDECLEYVKCIRENYQTRSIKTWEYHLQKMILEKEPIKYLERFL